jgi:acyl carrier protein
MVDFEAARAELLDWVAEAINTPVGEVDTSIPLNELGIDSLDAVHLIATIESILQQELPEDVIQRVKCLDDIFEMMQQRIAAA